MKKRLEKFLVRMAGEDYNSLVDCLPKTRRRLVIVGLVVCLIFLISFLSILEAFSEIFHSLTIGISIGLFFGWVIVNMYLLLLYTLARNVLVPDSVVAHSGLSYTIRLLTVIFFAIVVSKPIEHYLFKSFAKTEVAVENADRLDILQKSLFESYNRRIKDASSSDEVLLLTNERNRMYNKQKKIITNGNYYFLEVKLLNRNLAVWGLTLLLIWLFCLPVVLKRSIGPESAYYKNKKSKELDIIKTSYFDFKKEYSRTINQFTSEKLGYVEPFIDAPLNFDLRKDLIESEDEKIFLERVYGG